MQTRNRDAVAELQEFKALIVDVILGFSFCIKAEAQPQRSPAREWQPTSGRRMRGCGWADSRAECC